MKIDQAPDFHDKLSTLKERVLPIGSSGIDRSGVEAASLYDSSEISSSHFEGPEAISRLVQYVGWQREDGARTLSDDKYVDRLDRFITLAENILVEFPGVNSVVVYGSSLRGKAVPGDHDVMVLPNFPVELDAVKIKERLSEVGVPLKFERAEVNIHALLQGEIPEILHTGPYLLITRGKELKPGVPGLCRVFVNDSGEGWDDRR